MFDFSEKLLFNYKGHKGEINLRHVYPISMRYASTQWHTEEQWLLKAWDFAKGDYREFAMKEIIEFI